MENWQWIWKIWGILPVWLSDEIKLMLLMSLPGIGKGFVLAPFGVYWLKFSLLKTVFWCSMGSFIKITYFFPLVYTGEKFAERYCFLLKNLSVWLEMKYRENEFQQSKKQAILIFRFSTILLKYLIKKTSQFESWLEIVKTKYRTRYEIFGIGALAFIPLTGAGTFIGACVTCIFKVGFFKGALATAFGAVMANYLLGLFAPQILKFIDNIF